MVFWVLLCFSFGVLWRRSYLTYLEVFVEGHTTEFGLQCFSLCFDYLPGCLYSHYIGWRLFGAICLLVCIYDMSCGR